MFNYAIDHHYSYKRWQQITNNMIYKEENNTKIHRLRVIHIYESDLNFLLGLKWKEAMHHGLQNNLLHEGQYGSTPGK